MLPRRLFPLSSRFPGASRDAAARWGITAVTVIDTVTGEVFVNEMARLPIRSASVIKVPILCAAIQSRLAAGQGRQGDVPLSASERADAEAMIRRSDNAATTRFWKALGGPEVMGMIHRTAGTRDTVVAPENPNWWGYTHTTSYDLAMVLNGLAAKTLLPAPACDYVLNQMRLVVPSQRWGIPDGCPTPAAVAVKNGWYPEEDAGKVWRVHSIGVMPVGKTPERAVVSILTRYPLERGMRYGQETCRIVAAEVLRKF
jgi:beta-lactamase class A